MNAQEIWKELYREWKWKPIYEVGGNYPKYSWRGMMKDYRREAALERRIAALERTIEAQAQRIAELEDDIEAYQRYEFIEVYPYEGDEMDALQREAAG